MAAFAFEQLDAPAFADSSRADDVLAAALEEAEQLRAQARAAGEAEGRAAALAAAREQAAAPLAALAQAVREVQALRETLVAELERDALELAFTLCEQILAGTLDVQPERVVDVARNALRHLSDRRQVTLIVNPDDLAALSDAAAALQAQLGGIEHLAVQADRRVGRGGAIARTEAGEIDAELGVQLARARELVADALAAQSGDAG